MRIDADIERPVDAFFLAINANGLRRRQDMPFIERSGEGRSAMPRGSERHALRWNGWIGAIGKIRRDQFGNVDQILRLSWFPGGWVNAHVLMVSAWPVCGGLTSRPSSSCVLLA